MSSVPAPADPGRDEDPARPGRGPVTAEDQEAWLDRLCEPEDDPFYGPQEYRDPESCAPPPGQDELTAAELAGIAGAAADELLALDAASTGRLRIPHGGRGLIVAIDTLTTQDCQHRYEARGHDPESGCGTCPESGTPPAPARSAGGPPGTAISSTTFRMRLVTERACANAGPPCK